MDMLLKLTQVGDLVAFITVDMFGCRFFRGCFRGCFRGSFRGCFRSCFCGRFRSCFCGRFRSCFCGRLRRNFRSCFCGSLRHNFRGRFCGSLFVKATDQYFCQNAFFRMLMLLSSAASIVGNRNACLAQIPEDSHHNQKRQCC